MAGPNHTGTFGLTRFLVDEFRLLTFRATGEEIRDYPRTHMLWGVLLTLAAGFGRSWDDPAVEALRRSGLGSVAYVLVLALILWAFVRPLSVDGAGFLSVLTVVMMAAPPAFLYAVPVERWLSAIDAARVNLWLLAIVATWRVALLIFVFVRGYLTGVAGALLALFTPLSVIVAILGVGNLLHEMAHFMGGVRSQEDGIVGFLIGLGCFATVVSPFLIVFYAREVRETRDD